MCRGQRLRDYSDLCGEWRLGFCETLIGLKLMVRSRALLGDMPADLHAAFILILHLDPSHDSMMVDLLARHTALTVVQAADGIPLKAGHVYVIPPGAFLTVAQQVMHLSAPDGGKSVRLPFDMLLRSLAKDAAKQAGCIVLSGTGSDGRVGIAGIHAAGGLVLAQDPKDAGYPGMPESAIATGFVDQILPTSQMVAALDAFIPLTRRGGSSAKPLLPKQNNTSTPAPKVDYGELLSFLGDRAAQDISLYKRGTLERRIGRRMAMLGLRIEKATRYHDILNADPEELAQLSADLLIHVTGFFRDPKVFEHLSANVVPDLLAGMVMDRPLRVWVAGCSTGKEAYSLGMTFMEVMEKAGVKASLQIFASDVDPEAIAAARAGFFTKNIESDASPEWLARFFCFRERGLAGLFLFAGFDCFHCRGFAVGPAIFQDRSGVLSQCADLSGTGSAKAGDRALLFRAASGGGFCCWVRRKCRGRGTPALRLPARKRGCGAVSAEATRVICILQLENATRPPTPPGRCPDAAALWRICAKGWCWKTMPLRRPC